LHAGGITDDQIRFLCGPGTHRPMTSPELEAKLGKEIVARYPVYNHNNYENLVYIGKTTRGTPVHLNREYVACDLRLAIGGIIPHQSAGFGAGGKIILPGIAGIETVEAHHKGIRGGPEGATAKVGKVEGNAFRADIEEAARLADLQFKVDCVINNRREVVGLFAGDFVAEHRAGCRLAREVYHTELAKDADVLVTNGYPDEHQFNRQMWLVPHSLKEGGDFVMIGWTDDGQVLHQYAGRFGTEFGGRGWSPGLRTKPLAKAGRVILLAPQLSRYDRQELAPEKLIWCQTWGEVLAELATRNSAGTRAVLYPYAPIQLDARV
jgi:nickel-dependent lactate racemase